MVTWQQHDNDWIGWRGFLAYTLSLIAAGAAWGFLLARLVGGWGRHGH